MAVKKQPESNPGHRHEAADEWLRKFLKFFEAYLLQTTASLNSESVPSDFQLATLRAVKLTLTDTGMTSEQLKELFGLVAFEDPGISDAPEWNAQLNARRFVLIDQEIQGTLSHQERLELAALTQLMRMKIDSEANLPMQGARKLHRLLTEGGLSSGESGP